jgi:hypothetical protein
MDIQRRQASVRWISEDEAQNVRFILSANGNFQGEPLAVINNPPRIITLPQLRDGTYYWTIQAENTAGLDISSRPASFRVLPIPLLGQPQLTEPARDAELDSEYFTENRSIIFRWNPVAGANAYVFTLSFGGTRIIRTEPLGVTSFTLTELSSLENGLYTWQVESLSLDAGGKTEQQGETGESRFTLSVPRPGRPVLNNPGTFYGY